MQHTYMSSFGVLHGVTGVRCRDLLAADNKAYLRLIARLTYISHYERFGDLSTVL